MKLSDYVMKFLNEKGVQDIFHLAGGGCMHLTDSLGSNKNINEINLLHEQSVSIATESYAFAGDKVGVALVTTGPGATNAINGALSSYLDSIPCIFISGQVKTDDLKSNFGVRSHGSQEVDIITMVKEITKYSVMVTNKNDIKYYLEKAWYEATNGRKGSVWIDIPLDIQGSNVEIDNLRSFEIPIKEVIHYNEYAKQILESIRQSKRPLIMVGNGIRGYEDDFYSLINNLNIPVIPSWKGVDLIHNEHPLFAGKCGTLGERAANFAMQTSDLIISLGCKLDFSITGFNRPAWAPEAKKIVIDIDETEINKLNIPIDLKIVGNVENLLKELNILDLSVPSFENWRKKIKGWLIKYPVGYEKNLNDHKITTYELVDEVCRQLDNDCVIVPASAGTVAEIVYQNLSLKPGQKVRSNHGLGSMGYELPSAIGAFYGTKKEIIVFAGDGGIQLNIQELAIIAGRNLPIKIFIVNNNGYGSIMNMQRNHFQGRYTGSNTNTGLYLPDMSSLANAYNIKNKQITTSSELQKIVQEVLNEKGPVVCDVFIDPLCIVSPRSTSKVLPDGKIVSSPLEDLFPFLNEDILKEELDVFHI